MTGKRDIKVLKLAAALNAFEVMDNWWRLGRYDLSSGDLFKVECMIKTMCTMPRTLEFGGVSLNTLLQRKQQGLDDQSQGLQIDTKIIHSVINDVVDNLKEKYFGFPAFKLLFGS